VQDERLAEGKPSNFAIEENSPWVRGTNVQKESPEKPKREFTKREDKDEGGFLTRSDKPRAAGVPEE